MKNTKYVMFWAIWYHLYNLKNVKNTHGGVLLLVRLQVKLCSNIALSDFQPFICKSVMKSDDSLYLVIQIKPVSFSWATHASWF